MREKNGTNPTISMSVAREAAEASFLIFVGNTLSSAILAVASIVIARLLGPSDYGLYSISLIAPSILLMFTDFGANSALVRFTAKFKSQGRGRSISGLVKTGIVFELATALLMLSVSLSFADLLATYVVNRPGIGPLIQVASFVILGNALFATAGSVFYGLGQMGKAAATSVLRSIVKVVAAPALIITGLGVLGAVTGHVLSSVVAGILASVVALGLCISQRREPNEDPGFTSNLTLMVRYGVPLYASGLAGGLLSQYQSVVLAWLVPNADIGNFSIAAAFTTLIALLTTPISTALFPAFSKLDPSRNGRELKGIFLHSLRYTVFLTIPASFFIAVASRDLVAVAYGPSYEQAPLYLAIYSVTFLFAGFFLVLDSFFNGIGRTDLSLKSTLIRLPVAVPLVPLLAWLYGVPGFICATIISTAFAIAYLAWVAHQEYEMRFGLGRIIRILLASVLSSVPALGLTLLLPYPPEARLLLSAGVFVLVYLALSPVVGAVEHEDIENFMQMVKDIKPISKPLGFAITCGERMLSLVRGA